MVGRKIDKLCFRIERIVCLLMLCMFTYQVGYAQGDGARSQLLAPTGMWGVKIKWVHLNQNLLPSGNILETGSKVQVDVFPTTLFHTFAIQNRFAQVLFTAVPGSSTAQFNTDTSQPSQEFSASGFGDGFVGFKLGLVNAPALNGSEFSNREYKNTLFGFFRLWYPGSYDPDMELNMGTNRFTFEFGAPMSFPLGSNPSRLTWIEVFPSIYFFTDNNEPSGDTGAELLEQNPLFLIENHVTHNLSKKVWAGLDLRYQYGGQTFLDGEGQNNRQSILSGGIVMGYHLFSFMEVYANYGRILIGDNDAKSEMMRISATLKHLAALNKK